MANSKSDYASFESTWLGRTHFSRSICYRINSSATPPITFPLVSDFIEDLIITEFSSARGYVLDLRLEDCPENKSQITKHALAYGLLKNWNSRLSNEVICPSNSEESSTHASGAKRNSRFRSISLPWRGGASYSDQVNHSGVEELPEKKANDQSDIARAASWSDYLVTSGDEHAVEEAEEWMVDLSELYLGHKFAAGACSRLYLGKYKDTAVAVKILRKPEDDEEMARKLERQFRCEVKTLSRLQHRNIVKFIGACRKPQLCCIITEYLSLGSLRSYLCNKGPFSLPLPSVISMAIDIAQGMEYLHSQGVIHRDLKSENLIIAEDLCVKITDFGLACFESNVSCMTEDVGTYRWMAPEMIRNKEFSKKTDVYSFGIVMWELLTGQIPFEGLSPVQAAFAVLHKHARPPVPLNCPSTLRHLIHQCWSTDPDKRPDFSEVVEALEEMKKSSQLQQDMSTWQNPHRHTRNLLHCFAGCVSKGDLSVI